MTKVSAWLTVQSCVFILYILRRMVFIQQDFRNMILRKAPKPFIFSKSGNICFLSRLPSKHRGNTTEGGADTIIEKRNIPFLFLISTLFLDGLTVNDHAAFFSNYQIAIWERFYLHFLHGGDLQCGAVRMNGFYV